MANNVHGGSNDTALPDIRTDDVGGVQYQIVKLDVGAAGASTPVTAAAPLPVIQTGTPTLPTGAATQATLAAISGQLPASLGQKAAAASASVILASDQGALTVSSPGLAGGILQSVTTLTNGSQAYPIPASPLAGRASLIVQACDTNTAAVYIGKSTVTADTAATGGLKLLPGQSIPIQLSSTVILYAISASAGQLVQTTEVAA